MKKLLLGILLFSGVSMYAQNIPTLVSVEHIDTVCEYAGYYHILNITVEDLDADETSIAVNGFTYGYLSAQTVYIEEPSVYTGTETIRTFKVYAESDFQMGPWPTGYVVDEFGFDVIGDEVMDPGNLINQLVPDIYGHSEFYPTFDISGINFCENETAVDISGYASPAGGTFTIASEGNSYPFDQIFNPNAYYNNPDGPWGVGYEVYGPGGCYGYTESSVYVNEAPFIYPNAVDASCGNADGSADIDVINGAGPYDIYWSNGFSETTIDVSAITNVPSGVYYANATDANGCKAVAMMQVNDIEISLAGNVTDVTCPGGNDGSIALDITTSQNVDMIFWSNGTQTEDLNGIDEGEYTVYVTTDAGCEASETFWVNEGAPLEIDVYNMNEADCTQPDGGNSMIEIDIYNGSGNYSFLWSNGATTQNIYNIPQGDYSVVVTDIDAGCTAEEDFYLHAFNAPYIYEDWLVNPDCNQNNGEIYVWIDDWSNPVVSTSWSNGASTQNITNVSAGQHTITVTSMNGCVGSRTFKLIPNPPPAPNVCLLTVDQSLIYNQVIWEKDVTDSYTGFNVYRETSNFGVYEDIAFRPYEMESYYIDNAASPMNRSWRYYITAVDQCGSESDPSVSHKTIHTVANTTNSVDYTITWDDYEGIDYTDIDLWRFDNTNGWNIVANLPYGTNTYPDTPSEIAGLDYMVSFNLASPCTSSKVQDHNSSRSNKTSAAWEPGGSTTSIEDEDLGMISVYPNPTNGDLNIYFDEPDNFTHFEIVDMNGQLVYTDGIYDNSNYIDASLLAEGIYMVRIFGADKVIVHKIVKQ